jgi:hypothetical protein
MRGLPARRLASTTLCAAVLVGISGPAAVAGDSARERGPSASRVAVPGAEKLLAQVKALSDTGSVPDPVIDLLNQSLTKGKLPADRAGRLGDAAKKSLAEAVAHRQAAPATPTAAATPTATAAPAAHATPTATATPAVHATPTATATPAAHATPTATATPAVHATPTATATPAATAKPSVSATPTSAKPSAAATPASAVARAKGAEDDKAPAARDATDDALGALQTAIDNLVKALTSGLDQVLSSATGVVGNLVDLLTSTLFGGTQPTAAASLTPSLPAVPSLLTTG